MRNISLITRRELGAFLKAPIGYVIAAIVLFVDGLLFNYYALGGTPKYSAEVLELFFAFAAFMTMVSGVLISMRLFAEERQLGTLTLLMTAPVGEHEIVLGKFLSALVFLALYTLLTIYMPLMIFVNGKLSVGHIAGGYAGLLLLGAQAIAIGMFASSLTSSQVVAAITAAAMVAAIYLMHLGSTVADPPMRDVLRFISQKGHLQWQRGILQFQDVFYFISSTYLFLLLSTHVLKARRWR
ncbi:MAG: ABC transporter permease [Deltaproteobacteria bacterium]|nr:ABC transporter permease [Deltaproteobacteria bacterium]